MSKRTGPDTALLAAGLPAVTETPLATYKAGGNATKLTATVVTGGAGNLTLTLDAASDGATWADVHDDTGELSWVFDINTANVYEFDIPYDFVQGTTYRFSYKCDVAAGTLAINALNWENPSGGSAGATSSTQNTKEVNPVWEAHIEENKATATSQGDGTTYYYLDMDGYAGAAIHVLADTPGAAGDQAYTVEASLQDDGTAQASCTYIDVTQFGMDNMTAANAASYTTVVYLHTNAAFRACKWLRLKVVRANDGANTDGAWTIEAKRLY
ncbi:MAG: hypothetical protein GY832_23740 [Chloroflexi bacterium]|nr:hypothetical protein [Chloroflexota bacterium]